MPIDPDAALIAETLARQTLADRLILNGYAAGEDGRSLEEWWETEGPTFAPEVEPVTDPLTLPVIDRELDPVLVTPQGVDAANNQ